MWTKMVCKPVSILSLKHWSISFHWPLYINCSNALITLTSKTPYKLWGKCFNFMTPSCHDLLVTKLRSNLHPFISWHHHVAGLVQERCNSNELAMDLHLSCTNPSMWWPFCDHTKVKASPGPLSSCIIMAGPVSVPSSNRQFQRIPLTLSSEIVNSLRPSDAYMHQ